MLSTATLSQCSLFNLAFRPFFLLSACYTLWLLIRWTLTLMGLWHWQNEIPLFSWHAHEFQFGFALPVILGFILTAAQTWTGKPSIKGRSLMVMTICWIIARIGMNLNHGGMLASIIFDSAVLIIAIGVLSNMLIASQNKRNYIFMPILLGFLLLNAGQLWAMSHNIPILSTRINYATTWWLVFLISFMSVRVIPFFIAKGLGVAIKRESMVLTVICQLLILIIFTNQLLPLKLVSFMKTELLLNPLYLSLLIISLYRLILWYRHKIWGNSLLWSLWLSYAFLPLALLLLLILDNYSQALHLINLGFIGAMIMAFTCRVSLGHTGRKMQANVFISTALVCVIIASLARSIPSVLLPEYTAEFMAISAGAWFLGLVSFVYNYFWILILPREDGKAG